MLKCNNINVFKNVCVSLRLSKKDTHFGQNVGYCPQEGGLDEYLTAEEMLYFHARLRGLHPWQTEIVSIFFKCTTVKMQN